MKVVTTDNVVYMSPREGGDDNDDGHPFEPELIFFIFVFFIRDSRLTSQRQRIGGNSSPGKFLCQVERRFHKRESNRKSLS